eukprot:tig00000169_g11876.t1
MAAAGRRFRSDAEEDDDRSLTKEEEDEERAQPQKRRLLPKREEMMRLWNLARPEAPILLTAIACLGVASATSVAFPKARPRPPARPRPLAPPPAQEPRDWNKTVGRTGCRVRVHRSTRPLRR